MFLNSCSHSPQKVTCNQNRPSFTKRFVSVARPFIPQRQKATSHTPLSLKPKKSYLSVLLNSLFSEKPLLTALPRHNTAHTALHGAGFQAVFHHLGGSCACSDHVWLLCHLDTPEHRSASSRMPRGQPKRSDFLKTC